MIGKSPAFVFDPSNGDVYSKEEYRCSPYWIELKSKRIKHIGYPHCEICNKEYKSYDLHHVSYERYGFVETVEDVRILCRECHSNIHSRDWDKQRTIEERKREEYKLEQEYQHGEVLDMFCDYIIKFDISQGGNINVCNRYELRKLMYEFNTIYGERLRSEEASREIIATIRHNEINNMVLSGYASKSWSFISYLTNIPSAGIKTYRENLYNTKRANHIDKKINLKYGGNYMRKQNLNNVTEASVGGNSSLPSGGYVCRYVNVEDIENKEYLFMEFDIAEGEHKGYYKSLEERAGFWGGKVYRSYKEKALPMFKRMCSAVTKSNPGFIFDAGEQNSNEKTLVGKLVGMVFGEEEYVGNDGKVKTRLYVHYECDAEKIRKGDFSVPMKKTLNGSESPKPDASGFVNVNSDEDEVPFS